MQNLIHSVRNLNRNVSRLMSRSQNFCQKKATLDFMIMWCCQVFYCQMVSFYALVKMLYLRFRKVTNISSFSHECGGFRIRGIFRPMHLVLGLIKEEAMYLVRTHLSRWMFFTKSTFRWILNKTNPDKMVRFWGKNNEGLVLFLIFDFRFDFWFFS